MLLKGERKSLFFILGCGRATPARSPTRWEYPICRFCSRGAKPPRTPAVVLRPPSPTRRRTRGEPSCTPSVVYRPHLLPLARAPEGRSLRVHPLSYCAPYFPRVCCGKGAQHPLTLTRASEGRRAESESKSIDLRTKGEPSHTPSFVYRPHSPPLRRASEGQRPESESKS